MSRSWGWEAGLHGGALRNTAGIVAKRYDGVGGRVLKVGQISVTQYADDPYLMFTDVEFLASHLECGMTHGVPSEGAWVTKRGY